MIQIYKGYRIVSRSQQSEFAARNSMEWVVQEWKATHFEPLQSFPFRYLNNPETNAAYQKAEQYIDSLPVPALPAQEDERLE